MEQLDILRERMAEAYRIYRHSLPNYDMNYDVPFISWLPIKLSNRAYELLQIILWTRGCSWYNSTGGCFMCSYNVRRMNSEVTSANLSRQFNAAVQHPEYATRTALGVFPYSTLDLREIPEAAQRHICTCLGEKKNLEVVALEARAEHVSSNVLQQWKQMLPATCDTVIYLGVETRDDFIRENCVYKGVRWQQIVDAVDVIHQFGMYAGAFVLVKPPFLTEAESRDELLTTIQSCIKEGFDSVVILGVEIARYSVTDILHRLGKYDRVWHWTIFDALDRLTPTEAQRVSVADFTQSIKSSRSLGSSFHCHYCEAELAPKVVREFNHCNHQPAMHELDCRCKREWEAEISSRPPPLRDRILGEFQSVVTHLESLSLEIDGVTE